MSDTKETTNWDGAGKDQHAIMAGAGLPKQPQTEQSAATVAKSASPPGEQLRLSEKRLRTIADNVPQLIWTNEGDGYADYFNRRWHEYTGLTHEESAGLGWQKVVHPDDVAASVTRWQHALSKAEVFDCEYRLRGVNGEYRWFIGRNVPLREDGDVIGWFGTATDINDRKQIEAALRDSDERFQLLVQGTPDYAMFLLNPENSISFWSHGAERVFGWTRAEAIGRSGDIIFTSEDRAKGAVEEEISTAIRDGAADDRRWHLRKNGHHIWVDGVLRRLDHQDGSLRGFAKIGRDASEQHAMEEALRNANDEMEQQVIERTRELRATNRELERTIKQRQRLEKELLEVSEREKRRIGEDLHDGVCQELTATALLLNSAAKEMASRDAAAAQKIDECARMVNRNVIIARELARGLQAIDLAAIGLKDALRDLTATAGHNTQIKCRFKAGRDVKMEDDVAFHFYRIVQEALKNAIKHSGAKNILILLDQDETHACVRVQDDGKGFNSAQIQGNGLGLQMMRYRANALCGELTIKRRKKGGTEVTCRIPTTDCDRGSDPKIPD